MLLLTSAVAPSGLDTIYTQRLNDEATFKISFFPDECFMKKLTIVRHSAGRLSLFLHHTIRKNQVKILS